MASPRRERERERERGGERRHSRSRSRERHRRRRSRSRSRSRGRGRHSPPRLPPPPPPPPASYPRAPHFPPRPGGRDGGGGGGGGGGRGGRGGRGVCFRCGEPGHITSGCPQPDDRRGGGRGGGGGGAAGALRERLRGPDGDAGGTWGKAGGDADADAAPPPPPPEPVFELSGALAADSNLVATTGVVLTHQAPPDSAQPPPGCAASRARLYCFKGDANSEAAPHLMLASRATWLFGRERKAADVPLDHPSASKQHAVLQWRLTETERGGKGVRLYVMDLGSVNGTKLNGDVVESRRYVQVLHGDKISFGLSAREYVVMLDVAK